MSAKKGLLVTSIALLLFSCGKAKDQGDRQNLASPHDASIQSEDTSHPVETVLFPDKQPETATPAVETQNLASPQSEDTSSGSKEAAPPPEPEPPVQTQLIVSSGSVKSTSPPEPGLPNLLPYHHTPFHAVPHSNVAAVEKLAEAGHPVPFQPLSYPIGGGDKQPEEFPETRLAILPEKKEDLIPLPEEGIDPPALKPEYPYITLGASDHEVPPEPQTPAIPAPALAIIPEEAEPKEEISPEESEPKPEPESGIAILPPSPAPAPAGPAIVTPPTPEPENQSGAEPEIAVVPETTREEAPVAEEEAPPVEEPPIAEEPIIVAAPVAPEPEPEIAILPEEPEPEPEIASLPEEPEPEPEIASLPEEPEPEPEIAILPEEPEPEPEIVILPEEPEPEPEIAILPEEPEPELEILILPEVHEPANEIAPPVETQNLASPQIDTSQPEPIPEIAVNPEPTPEPEPAIPIKGPDLDLQSPMDLSYYQSSVLLKGICIPSSEAPEETRDIKSLTWRIDALGDYDNMVFLEEDGSFELDVFTAGLEGAHSLIMKTVDFGGRITSREIPLQDGNQPPQIILEYPPADGAYGSMLSVKGSIKDVYKGMGDLEGIARLGYTLIPRDRSSVNTVLKGEAVLQEDDFFFALDMVDRTGRYSLVLEAEGINGAVGRAEVALSHGDSDIPSFTVKPQDSRLIFDWDSIPGAENQTVYLTNDGTTPSDANGGSQFSAVKSPLTLGGVQNGKLYKARLKVEAGGFSYWSEVMEAVPLAPGTLDLKAEGRFEQIRLEWKSITGASAFRIYRREENEKDFTLLADPVEGTEFVDAAVEFGRTYYYRIEPSGIPGPLSYEVPAASLEAPSEKITMSSYYREMTPVKLTVSGEYAYVAAGDTGFYIMDVSTPQKPEKIGHLDIGNVQDVYITDEYAYIAAGDEGFYLVNIEEPTKPFVVMSRVTDNAIGIAGRNNMVYVADGERGVQIFNIANRQDPFRMGTYRDVPAYQLALEGNLLYIAAGAQGMRILDISDPSSPALVSSYSDAAVYDVLLRDEKLYLACGGQGMVILEDQAGDLVELSRFRSNNARTVRLWEDYAMIADGSGGMKAVDVTLPEDPHLFGSFPGEDTRSVAMAEDYALIADVSGLKVVRTYLYGQSIPVLSIPTAGRAYGVLVDDNSLWVADRRGGVAQYDISNPSSLSESSLLRVYQAEYAEDVLLMDDLVYVADGPAGVKVFDRTSSSEMAVSSIPVSGRARRILPYGSSVVVVSSGDGVMFLKNNMMTGRINLPDVRDAAFYGSYLFVGDYREGLIVMDAAGGERPVELDRLEDFSKIRQLLIKGTTLYVLYQDGIALLDIQNPEHPVQRGMISYFEAEGMQLSDKLLYVAGGFQGVSVYRIREDLSVMKVSDCPEIFAVDVADAGRGYAVYANMDGIGIIQVLIPDWISE